MIHLHALLCLRSSYMFQTRKHTVVREPLFLFKCFRSSVCVCVCVFMCLRMYASVDVGFFVKTAEPQQRESRFKSKPWGKKTTQYWQLQPLLFFPSTCDSHRHWTCFTPEERLADFASFRAPSRNESLYVTSLMRWRTEARWHTDHYCVPPKKRSCQSGVCLSV